MATPKNITLHLDVVLDTQRASLIVDFRIRNGTRSATWIDKLANGQIVSVTLSNFLFSSFLALQLAFCTSCLFCTCQISKCSFNFSSSFCDRCQNLFVGQNDEISKHKDFDKEFLKNKTWYLNSASLALAPFQLREFYTAGCVSSQTVWIPRPITASLCNLFQTVSDSRTVHLAASFQQLSMLCSKLSKRAK